MPAYPVQADTLLRERLACPPLVQATDHLNCGSGPKRSSPLTAVVRSRRKEGRGGSRTLFALALVQE